MVAAPWANERWKRGVMMFRGTAVLLASEVSGANLADRVNVRAMQAMLYISRIE